MRCRRDVAALSWPGPVVSDRGGRCASEVRDHRAVRRCRTRGCDLGAWAVPHSDRPRTPSAPPGPAAAWCSHTTPLSQRW